MKQQQRKEEAAFVFIKRSDPENQAHSHEHILRVYSHDIDLPSLVEAFEDFLRSCGYSVEMGSLGEKL